MKAVHIIELSLNDLDNVSLLYECARDDLVDDTCLA